MCLEHLNWLEIEMWHLDACVLILDLISVLIAIISYFVSCFFFFWYKVNMFYFSDVFFWTVTQILVCYNALAAYSISPLDRASIVSLKNIWNTSRNVGGYCMRRIFSLMIRHVEEDAFGPYLNYWPLSPLYWFHLVGKDQKYYSMFKHLLHINNMHKHIPLMSKLF